MQQLSTNTFGPAKFIVTPSATPWLGTHTTIASAITSAAGLGGNQTIAILPGTYTENLTLRPGINLTGWGTDASQSATGTVVIIGKLSFSSAGTVNIYGIQLQTNSDFCVEITGSAVSRVELTNCYVNCSNNTGLNLNSSGVGSYISLLNCNGDVGFAGGSLFDVASGALYINDSFITNSISSTTPSSNSGTGRIFIQYSVLSFPVNSSGSGGVLVEASLISNGSNTTCLTSSAGTLTLNGSIINSGSATAIVVNTPGQTQISLNNIASSNASVISGTGSGNIAYNYFPLTRNISLSSFTNSGAQGCVGGAPFVGAIGEQIRSFIPVGSAVSLTNNTGANITSISLSAGTWDISAIGAFSGVVTGTLCEISINDTSATASANFGDQTVATSLTPSAVSGSYLTLPSFRVTLATTTTYYLVAFALFTIGSLSAFGRISAVRSG